MLERVVSLDVGRHGLLHSNSKGWNFMPIATPEVYNQMLDLSLIHISEPTRLL